MVKIGLEIHRQIESHKLFCKCPSQLQESTSDIKVKRFLRAVTSETGEKDLVAEYEMAKQKYAEYEAYEDTTCLVELDESPPEPLNEEALKAVLEVALLLHCDIVDELIIMRKQVLDFSNTSGFQRTVLVARNGYVEVKGEKIRINTLCLEEDAARKIKEEKDYVVYRLDRLGIPLIEITTKPDITNAQEAKEVASYLGMILKSTGKFKAGIGTIRQDVNISVEGGARVEIKGVQDLRSMDKVVELEIMRQQQILKDKGKVREEVRNVQEDNTTLYLRPMPGAARMYVETDVPSFKITQEFLKGIKKPVLLTEKIERVEEKYHLHAEIARALVQEDYLELFEELHAKFHMPDLIAKTLVLTTKDLKSRLNLPSERLKKKDFEEVFGYVQKGLIDKDAVDHVLADKLEGRFDLKKYEKINEKDLEFYIKNIIKEKNELSDGALMGIIMKEYQGKVNGKKVMEILKKIRGD